MKILLYALYMCTGGLGCQFAQGPFSQATRCEERRDALNVGGGPYQYKCRVSETEKFVPEVGH